MSLVDQLRNYQAEEGLFDENGEISAQVEGLPQNLSEYAAPGIPALYPAGIVYSADWKGAADGTAKHAREQVLALAAAGVPVRLETLFSNNVLDVDLSQSARLVQYLEHVTFSRTLLAIRHLVVGGTAEYLKAAICPRASSLTPEAAAQVAKSTIIYTPWERDTVAPEIVEVLRGVGQVWVPCIRNFNVFVAAGIEQTYVVPYPFHSPDHTIAAPRGREESPTGKRFYNIGKWEPRKNHHRLLGGFLLAFQPTDKASLFIKTSPFGGSWQKYPSPEDSIRFWLDEPDVRARGWDSASLDRLVRIVDKKVSDEDIRAIHEKNNIYVSASHGEAWDIPAFEAKCAGNTLVYTDFGGPEDYTDGRDVVVLTQPANVHPDYNWEKDAGWGDYSVETLAAAMRAAMPPVTRIVSPRLMRYFSRHVVGEQMKRLIQKLVPQIEEIGGAG